MKRGIFLGLVLAAYALGTTGCGDDEDDDNGDGGGGTSGTGGSMNVMCDEGGDGDCQNETDCPKVENGEARASAQDCGEDCQQDPDPATCAVGCIVLEAEITQACAVCYATLVGCAAENCLAECSNAAATEECNQCQIESGCRGDFDDCSGLTTVPPM
jgi:hypothetical protein